MDASEGIKAWIIKAGLAGVGEGELVTGYCERLVQAGVPIWRASVGADTLHPLIDAQGHRWFAGIGVHEEHFHREESRERRDSWLNSTWRWMIENEQPEMRRKLYLGEGADQFPLLADLAAQGGTDYWSIIIDYGAGAALGETQGVALSWTTRDPVGFQQAGMDLIRETMPVFALAYKAAMTVNVARVVARTYMGEDVANRVLRGDIERGKVKTVRKVLWFSDLTGFTRLADTLPRDQLLDLLNAYADCLVGVVHGHGGEVLKFLGDGILAVIGKGGCEACQRALDAASAARAAVAALNEARSAAGLPTTGFTLALHEGEVHYGNIGSRDRLDFTVVGPAVNEASRIQAMSRSLDQPILISATFAAACGPERRRVVSVGRYALRGVERPQELFTLDDGAVQDAAS
ncbi:adenylate/guanylate cyclase domain-containing protein [Skermanella stibiiresistens]|nr:adenylate/guanylate cyclase domain-containing protein [Skermanella stibiiresistens]